MSTTQHRTRRTALITGGTGSLGFRTAQAILANPGWGVVITGRNPGAVAEAAGRLGDRAIGLTLDLGWLSDVRRVAHELPPLDAVVCNAGVHTISGSAFTSDGIEQTFGVNHLGHFLLVRELLPKLTTPGRVVLVSSAVHDPTKRTGFPPPHYTSARALAFPSTAPTEDPFRAGRRAYTVSKLCNLLATYEFARRTAPEVATFNAFDPGQMPGTGIARDYRGLRAFGWRYVLPVAAVIPGGHLHTARRSGAALARLVVDPKLAGVTGTYFSGRRPIRSSEESYDLGKAADLWATSVELTAGPGRVRLAGRHDPSAAGAATRNYDSLLVCSSII
jgi:NAD(P)-dependent dehydrogenase (short-subunit alcohol dehydrogenase family)